MAITKIHYTPGQNVTVKANGALNAGTFVEVTGYEGRNPVVKTAAADKIPFGVVAHDCSEGEYVAVYRAGHIVEVAATGNFTPGTGVKVGANGKAAVVGDTDTAHGLALDAAVNGLVKVALN